MLRIGVRRALIRCHKRRGCARIVMKIFLRRHSLGIPARLTMLAVVTALPLVAVGSFALLRTVDDQRAQIKNDVKQMVESFLADVDREISAIWAELQVLATSPSLQSGNFLEFDQQMRAALKIRGTSIVLHDTHAQQLLSTNRPFGKSLRARRTVKCMIASSQRASRRFPTLLWARC